MRIPPHTLHRSIFLEMINLILAKENNIERPTQNNSTSVTNNYPSEGDTSLFQNKGELPGEGFSFNCLGFVGSPLHLLPSCFSQQETLSRQTPVKNDDSPACKDMVSANSTSATVGAVQSSKHLLVLRLSYKSVVCLRGYLVASLVKFSFFQKTDPYIVLVVSSIP